METHAMRLYELEHAFTLYLPFPLFLFFIASMPRLLVRRLSGAEKIRTRLSPAVRKWLMQP